MADVIAQKPLKIPGPDHPITVALSAQRIKVIAAGRTIADTGDALTLREANYPPVYYIPREDVDMTQLVRTDHASYCPYKGDASYFSLPASGSAGENAVWSYETPYPAVAGIKDHLAFYANRVEIQELPIG